jgi:hypothetical protein
VERDVSSLTQKTDLQERTGRTEERIWSHLKEQQPRQE